MSNKPKQVAILGLGIFGSTLAETLEDFGVEVLAVDIDPQLSKVITLLHIQQMLQ